MATITKNPLQLERTVSSERGTDRTGLNVSAYDQVSGMLIAVLVGLGFVVGLMVVAWYSNRTWLPKSPVAVKVIKDVGGSGQGKEDGGVRPVKEEFDEPAADEISPAVADTNTTVTESLNAISLTTSQPEVLAELTLGELSSSKGKGIGTGTGDERKLGPGNGPGDEAGIDSWERWEVRLNAATTEEYARQLDFFKIELALAGGGSPVVTYVTSVSNTKPSVRTGSPREEKRLRFMHRSGVLRDADRRLVQKAGIDPGAQVVFQFYSPATYQELLRLENLAMGNRSISEVRRTVFGVKPIGDKFEFYVISQEYR